MQLSAHFTKEELTYSDTAIKYKSNNEPNEIELKTLKHTCDYFLEPLRKLLNEHYINKNPQSNISRVVINPTSGFRSKNVNNLLRKEGYHPSDTSQHCKGEAVDLKVTLVYKDGKRAEVPYTMTYKLIKDFVKSGKLSVDQCIEEKSGSRMWVHCSYKAGGDKVNRKQFLKYINGKYFQE